MHLLTRQAKHFQLKLESWLQQANEYPDSEDPYFNLAMANCHALVLFLCRNFTYYSFWGEVKVPWLAEPEITAHVNAITSLSEVILETSSIPGVLLLFPLRMAGSNATDMKQRQRTSKLLTRVSQKGFIISERITVDLQELWNYENKIPV